MQGSSHHRAQLAPEQDDEDPDEAPGEQAGNRPAAIEADEVPEVTEGRLVALPLAARARLMAVRRAVAEGVGDGASGVVVGRIDGEIELGIAYYTERVVREAEERNAALLVWEIETPGGRVDAAVMMRDYILESRIPSVAFVDRRAWSAGALISLANDLIVMAEGASIGAATPIQMGGGGAAQPVEEKIVSALRGEFRSTAEATGRSAEIAESMVDADIAVGGVIPQGRLLTLTGGEAFDVGIAEGRVSDLDELLELLGLGGQEVIEVNESWAESLVRLLTSSTVSGLLMTLGLLGIFFELTSPGFGWAGAMGIGALALFFAGHLLVNLAGLEELLLFIIGIGLLAVELLVIPGFGVVGIAGLLAIGASLTLALVNLDIDLNLSPVGLEGALIRVLISLLGTIVGIALIFKYLPRTQLGRGVVLATVGPAGPATAGAPEDRIGVGDVGKAVTDLKPFGKARLGDERIEVVAEGGYVTKGSRVRVIRIAGTRIEVRGVDTDTSGG